MDLSPVPYSPWSPGVRGIVSAALLLHLAAVVIAPLSGPPPASDLSQAVLQPFRPWLGALYLRHGYRFFAPDPGPGHSIRWEVTLADGSTRTGSIPDAERDWPRLLYHRRFMVAEKLAPLVPPPDVPAEVRARARTEWLPLVKDVAANLLRREGGVRVRLDLVAHYLPAPDEVRSGRSGPDLVISLGSYMPAGARP